MKTTLIIFAILWTTVAIAADLPWQGAPATIHTLEIQVDNPQQQAQIVDDWDKLVREVIGIEPGDLLTQSRWKSALSALEAFGHVRSRVHSVPQGVTVHILLLPYQRIKSIGIDGAYPLFERDVRSLMTLAPGDIYNPVRIMEQVDLIAQRYRAEGYIDPEVDITWEQDLDDGHVMVSIDIQKGQAYRLDRLQLAGNKVLSEPEIKGRMSIWRTSVLKLGVGRLVRSRIGEDLEKLTAYYRSQGYADVRIDHTVTADPRQRTADIRIDIQEGPRYIIEFDGNHAFSDTTLKRDIGIFKKGNQGNMGLRRTVQNIRRRYLEAGYADVRVRWQEVAPRGTAAKERKVRIKIDEGVMHVVRRVNIVGHQTLSTEEIQAQMLIRPPNGLTKGRFVAALLQEDLRAIAGLYHQNGYLDAHITEAVEIAPKTRQVEVTLTINEGPQTRVGRVMIEGPSPVPAHRLTADLPLKTGDIYRPQMVADAENQLSTRVADQGFPHIQVQTRVDLSEDRTLADLTYHLEPGPRVEIGRIFWAGNFRTRNTLLRREINLKKGQPFSLSQVLNAQRRLRDLDLFQSVQMRSIGLKEKASKVHLLVTMVEKPAYFFELGTGFRTDKGIYGRIQAGDRNFLGLNKEVRLGGEVSAIGYRWEADIIEPRLLDTRISANLAVFTERREEFNQDFGTDTTGGNLTFSRPWGQKVTTALGVRYERRQQYLRERDAATTDIDPETLEPRTLWVTTPSISYDSRDSFIRPRKGGYASVAADLSKGLDTSLDDFVKYKLDLRTYYTLWQQLTLAGRALAGYIQPYAVDGALPEDQLFFLGGTTDVRGFAENLLRFNADQDPVGGRLALSGSIEARYAVTPSWELALFVDTGTIQEAPAGSDDEDDRWRWTAGLGLSYITPIGPIGLLYGHKLDPRPGESDGQWHFSIGYTF